MKYKEIINKLPYHEPFLFVEALNAVSSDGVEGSYTFKKDEYFYKGHFKNNPITPGVIITECMAQIGVVCLGIYLMSDLDPQTNADIALSNFEIDFYHSVLPGEEVSVVSEKIYFRFNKLKCSVKMLNQRKEIVAKGTISGMVVNNKRL